MNRSPQNPRIIEETRQYIRNFDRVAETTTTARELYGQMLELYQDRVNPGLLWASARAHAWDGMTTLREKWKGRRKLTEKNKHHLLNENLEVLDMINICLLINIRSSQMSRF